MNFEEFENLARLYVVGALEDGEEEAFLEARQDFGARAEELIAEFRQREVSEDAEAIIDRHHNDIAASGQSRPVVPRN